MTEQEQALKRQTFSIGDVFGKAWKLFSANAWLFIGAFMLMAIAGGIGSFFTSENFTQNNLLMQALGNVISFVLSSFISIGATKLILDKIDGKKAGIETLFQGSRWLMNYLLASLIIGVIVGLGLIMLIIPGIYLGIRLMFAGYFIVDRNMNAIDAIGASWNATKSSALMLFAFILAAIVVNFFGLIALVVGLLVTAPLTSIAFVYAYRSFVSLQAQASQTPQAPVQPPAQA